MLHYDVIVSVCVLFSILLMFVLPGLFGAALQKRQDLYSRQLSGFTGALKDFLSGFEVMKAYRMKKYVLEKFEASNTDAAAAKLSADRLIAANEAVSMFLSVMVQVVVLFLSAYFIIIGRITAGTLLAMVQVSSNLANPLLMIFSNVPKLKGAGPVIRRLNRFADYGTSTESQTSSPSLRQEISIQDLSFSYSQEQGVLNGISLSIKQGKKYALVGKSGCGKSTFIKLLTGYFSEYQGRILYDGVPLCDLDYDQIAELSSTIHQDVYMFHETIEDNICLHQNYTESQLQEALNVSGVAEFLDQTPQGLASPVGENGALLSGGQKQRIAVARAIIRKKPFLILDEGTSAVDMQTAYDIESRLLQIRDLTLLTITHSMRKDILELYDEILYMEEGRITEQGSFDELLQKQGSFSTFFHLKR